MSDLRQTVADWRQGMNLLGMSGDNVNWQSIVVLLSNVPEAAGKIKGHLTRDGGGWSTFGMAEDSDGTSAYLSPKGMIYWLRYGGHYGWYDDILDLNQNAMDRAGWLHISDGRVDVHCRITPAQQRWLDKHKPDHRSANSREGDWHIKPYEHTSLQAAPQRYLDAERYDVRPLDHIDSDENWDRLMLRIHQARHGNGGTD